MPIAEKEIKISSTYSRPFAFLVARFILITKLIKKIKLANLVIYPELKIRSNAERKFSRAI